MNNQPPPLTDQQRADALAKATESRRKVADFKKSLAKLDRNQTDLFGIIVKAQQDETLSKIKVLKFLEALPGVGKVRARDIMDHIGIAENRRMKGLGAQQREELVFTLHMGSAMRSPKDS